MKKHLLLISLTLILTTSFGQGWWGIDFDNQYFLDRIYIDTIANTNCSWQIGQPNKPVFVNAHSVPNAIVTNTLNAVPINDTSVFYLKHVRDNIHQPFHIFILHFWYQMDGDLADKGIIEISPDTGHTWINVLTQDTTFQMSWQSPKPTLNGSTSGWQSFDLELVTWASANDLGYPILPIYMTADTILFRFTYITDSSSTPHDGWIIDDFLLEDWAEGIQEIQNDNLISIFPNPTSDELIIHRIKPNDNQRIQILNYLGQVVYDNQNFIGETIDTRQLDSGVFYLKYSDTKSYAIKTFVVTH